MALQDAYESRLSGRSLDDSILSVEVFRFVLNAGYHIVCGLAGSRFTELYAARVSSNVLAGGCASPGKIGQKTDKK